MGLLPRVSGLIASDGFMVVAGFWCFLGTSCFANLVGVGL